METKNADVGEGAKLPHLSYVGDADVGAGANVGAGTITANYDGKHKHHTTIGPNARTGSNSVLVAPVEVGDGAYTAAGSVVTRDVPADALASRRPGENRGRLGRRAADETEAGEIRWSSSRRSGCCWWRAAATRSCRRRSPTASRSPSARSMLSTFANGELYCRYGESVRGADVFVIQSHTDPVNDRIMEQLIMIDAAKRASAKRITAVCPFYGYARQDRKAEGREPITARLVADLLSVAGADRVVTVDLHTGQIQGFFDFPVDHLTAVPLLAKHIAESISGEVTVVSPDAGGGKLARRYANHFLDFGIDAELAFIDKRRPKGTQNVAEAVEVVGEVEGRVCVLVDDMIDTAGTIASAADAAAPAGGHRRGGRGHPRGALGAGGRPAQERPDPGGGGLQHPRDPLREAVGRPPGASRSPP